MRGTVAGKEIFRSTKQIKLSDAKRVADKTTRDLEECAEFVQDEQDTKLFAEAAVEYIRAGGERRYVEPLIDQIGMMLLTEINQEFLDNKGRELYPDIANSTLIRRFYTPIIAVHRFSAKREWCPAKLFDKPSVKTKPTEWAELDWFNTFWKYCSEDLFRLTVFLPYTGCRITECLKLEWEDTDLKAKWAYIKETKNGESRTVNLPDVVVDALSSVPENERTGKIFPWTQYQSVNNAIRRTTTKIHKDHGIKIKYLSTHKIGSHTYGTWMMRDARLDIKGLVDTRRWKDLRSAARYAHTSSSEANKKSDLLPTINTCKTRAEGAK